MENSYKNNFPLWNTFWCDWRRLLVISLSCVILLLIYAAFFLFWGPTHWNLQPLFSGLEVCKPKLFIIFLFRYRGNENYGFKVETFLHEKRIHFRLTDEIINWKLNFVLRLNDRTHLKMERTHLSFEFLNTWNIDHSCIPCAVCCLTLLIKTPEMKYGKSIKPILHPEARQLNVYSWFTGWFV